MKPPALIPRDLVLRGELDRRLVHTRQLALQNAGATTPKCCSHTPQAQKINLKTHIILGRSCSKPNVPTKIARNRRSILPLGANIGSFEAKLKLNAFTTGEPFLGNKFLEVSIGRDFGGSKGVKALQKDKLTNKTDCDYSIDHAKLQSALICSGK